MPDVRLSGDFLGHKAGETVGLSNDEYSEALHACVVGKTYPRPVASVPRHEVDPVSPETCDEDCGESWPDCGHTVTKELTAPEPHDEPATASLRPAPESYSRPE